MNIIVNGEPHEIEDGISVHDLLVRNNIKPALVAVEINGVIVSKKEYETRTLQADDRIEIVHFVGGG